MGFEKALAKIIADANAVNEEDLVLLLGAAFEERKLLYDQADILRGMWMGSEVHLRGIIEFSNCCTLNCLYCGLRADNKKLKRYRMIPGEIISAAGIAAGMGLKTIVLQSGQDPYYTREMLSEIIVALKEDLDVAVTLSLGVRSPKDLRAFREAGADRYLLKFETSDPGLFEKLRPGTNLRDRLECLRLLKETGFQVASGNIIGLPGQTLTTLARDILLLRELDVVMAGVGPFVPHPDTPLGKDDRGDLEKTLNALAVTRLLLPYFYLPTTTALDAVHPRGRRLALQCGANVVMPNVTPGQYREHYSIYPNKPGRGEDPRTTVKEIRAMISEMGRIEGKGYGHAPGRSYRPQP